MPINLDSRTIFLLAATLFIFTTLNAQLYGQESAFDPSSSVSSIDSVDADLSAVITQQDNAIEIGAEGDPYSNVVTTEAFELPNTAPYSTPTTSPEIGSLSDVGVPYTASQPRSNGLFGGIRNYFREASINAPEEGVTISLLGGGAYAGGYVDGFGRSTGDVFRVGDTLGFAIGKRFNRRIRSDFELSWRTSERGGYLPTNPALGYLQIQRQYQTELKHFSGMLNFYYDFERPRGSFLTPYIGTGLGATKQDYQYNADGQPRYENSDTGFAFQAMIGVSAQVMAHNELFIEQRAFSISENNNSRTINDVLFGWRYTF